QRVPRSFRGKGPKGPRIRPQPRDYHREGPIATIFSPDRATFPENSRDFRSAGGSPPGKVAPARPARVHRRKSARALESSDAADENKGAFWSYEEVLRDRSDAQAQGRQLREGPPSLPLFPESRGEEKNTGPAFSLKPPTAKPGRQPCPRDDWSCH